MCQTLGANRNLPGSARKPGKLGGWRPKAVATAYLAEAPDFKHNTAWIGKGVPVRSVDGNACGWFGYFLTALPAKQPVVIVIRPFVPGGILYILLLEGNVFIFFLLFSKCKYG